MAAVSAPGVDKPIPNCDGRQRKEGPPLPAVSHGRLIKGKHGDGQRVVLPFHREPAQKLGGLRADKGEIAAHQSVGSLNIVLGGAHLGDYLMFLLHRRYPSFLFLEYAAFAPVSG